MNSEITDEAAEGRKGRWLLFDGHCRFCTTVAQRLAPALREHGIRCAPLQEDWIAPTLNLSEDELLREMRLLDSDGTFVSGATAVVRLSRLLWWARPITWLAKLPGGHALLERGYRWVATHRNCAKTTCSTRRRSNLFLPLLLLILILILIFPLNTTTTPRWIVMWSIAGATWLWLKFFTLREVAGTGTWPLRLAYLLAWPGTDALSFFTRAAKKPQFNEWFGGALNLALGLTFIALAAGANATLATGWIGMIGLILVLHFGSFNLLSCVWRAKGVDARPLMHSPLLAQSLGEFWGRRWNTAFSTPARRHIFEPLQRKVGPVAALAVVFLGSGIVHELAISVPAQGGYGLPTLYFAFQGVAVLFERSKAGKWLGLGNSIRGRVFVILCAAGPAFWLFHPPFVERVILPFFEAINSTTGALL